MKKKLYCFSVYTRNMEYSGGIHAKSLAGYVKAYSIEEAEGLALKWGRDNFPPVKWGEHQANVFEIPDEFLDEYIKERDE